LWAASASSPRPISKSTVGRELDEALGVRERVLEAVDAEVRLGAELQGRQTFRVDLQDAVDRPDGFFEVADGEVRGGEHQAGRDRVLRRLAGLLERPDGAARVFRLDEGQAEAVVRLRKIRSDGQDLAELVDRLCKLPNVLQSAYFPHARIDIAPAASGQENDREDACPRGGSPSAAPSAGGRLTRVE
jgi:hypothetical protein